MDIQQVAPWISLVASLLTFVYVGLQEWRRGSRGETAPHGSRPSLGRVVASADVFLFLVVSMLFLAGVTHYLLLLTPAAFLVVPVWLVTLFVIVLVGLVQTMPGETFDEKIDRFTDRMGADVDIDVAVERGDDSAADAGERPEK